MAIKINLMPKKEYDATGPEPRRPFYLLIVFIFFVIILIVYLGIYSYNTFFLKKQLEALEKQSAGIQEEISKSVTASELSTVTAAVIKGKSIHSILAAHIYGSNIYDLLEKLTLKSVSYSKFSGKIGSDNTVSVSVDGEADGFKALAEQLTVFKKSNEIKDVIFNEAALGKNAKVSFSLVLNFDSKLLSTQPVITLLGFSTVKITAGSDYSDAGATATDGIDGRIAVATSGSVDTKVAGTYTLTYRAVNSIGNFSTATRIVNVMPSAGEAVSK